uniref:TrmE-type G domain-containing protein n=1 Tax=Heligmosomoides polygyrus TaxID=6339 RepID=A0A8L8K488_HELPZ
LLDLEGACFNLEGALFLFRSLKRSLPVLREITRKEKWRPREMRFTKIFTKRREILDTAMAVYLPGPSTFTGEDTAELFVHGSRAVADALAERLAAFEGVRQATRGEFTKRAFFNGKMDLHEVHGLRHLISAETQRQRQMAYGQMRGGAECICRDMLSDAMMRAFILMDFGEHVNSTRLRPIVKEVSRLVSRAHGAEIVHKGLRAVIFGRPNTGKSSLMNALVHDLDIVISVLKVRLNIAGVPMSLTDTAGIRDTVDSLEKEGIDRCDVNASLTLRSSLVFFSEAHEELECALSVRDTALLADHLQRALDIFGQMAGSTVSEQILDDLFKQFCIGK